MARETAFRRLFVTASTTILVALAAAVGLAPGSQASVAAEGGQDIQATSCDSGSGWGDLDPSPYDDGGTDAYTWCYGHPHNNATVEWHAYGEHLIVWDDVANSRYAWGAIKDLVTGQLWLVRASSSSGIVDRNLSITEGHRVAIQACEGSSTNYSAYGCGDWYYATA